MNEDVVKISDEEIRWLEEVVDCKVLALTWAKRYGLYDADTVADDVSQDVQLNILTKPGGFASPGQMIAFARIVARNHVVNVIRKRERSGETMLVDEYGDVVADTEEAERNELSEVFERCLSQLQDRARQVLEMRYYEGTPFSTIAEAVQLSVVNARKTAERARQALKSCLDRHQVVA